MSVSVLYPTWASCWKWGGTDVQPAQTTWGWNLGALDSMPATEPGIILLVYLCSRVILRPSTADPLSTPVLPCQALWNHRLLVPDRFYQVQHILIELLSEIGLKLKVLSASHSYHLIVVAL